MEEKKIKNAIEKIKKEIAKMDRKDFKVLFFVYDTKGVPSGSLTYIYKTAYALKKEGYKVSMLHAEKEFVGVADWLGEKYANLPHLNTEQDAFDVSPSDFLFIPEIYANVMSKTKELPCKRVVILQNYDLMTELIPVGATWKDLRIDTCITTTQTLADKVSEVFPYVKHYIVNPCVGKEFKKYNDDINEKKLIVNIVSKDSNEINSIVKPFKWKYPQFGFVSFRYLGGLPKEDFAEALKESVITIWSDTFTDFGISAIEAMACDNIVIGKIPERSPEWMFETETDIKDNGYWYYNTNDVHALIANAVNSFLHDSVSHELKNEMKETVEKYNENDFINNVKETYKTLFNAHCEDLKDTLTEFENKLNEKES